MLSKTSESIVTSHHPSSIGNAISNHPAGSFRVLKEEELIEGLSYTAYRAVSISCRCLRSERGEAVQQFVEVSGRGLAVALDADWQMLANDAVLLREHEPTTERATLARRQRWRSTHAFERAEATLIRSSPIVRGETLWS